TRSTRDWSSDVCSSDLTACTRRTTFWRNGCACTRASATPARLFPWAWSANPRCEAGKTGDDIHQVRPVFGGGEARQREPAERTQIGRASCRDRGKGGEA